MANVIFLGHEGFATNYKLSVTVASNNLTVALKGADGNNPSATNPITVRIGSAEHIITSALSVTKNAGTNWCNAGSSELATKEVDYFVYLGYNATDGVVIGFSRIPYVNRYDGFSTTSTNEKYCAISTITNAAASDGYVNIGRFAATLSAGAGYTWSVPTFTADNLIQRPIFETRWMFWQPSFTGFSSIPTGSYSYKLSGEMCNINQLAATNGTSNATTFTQTFPFTFGMSNSSAGILNAWDNSSGQSTLAQMQTTAGSAAASYYKAFYQVAWTASGTKNVYCPDFMYRLR